MHEPGTHKGPSPLRPGLAPTRGTTTCRMAPAPLSPTLFRSSPLAPTRGATTHCLAPSPGCRVVAEWGSGVVRRHVDVVGAYKSITTVQWLQHLKSVGKDMHYPCRIWQSRYNDRVIRTGELERTRRYIRNNPNKLQTSSPPDEQKYP